MYGLFKNIMFQTTMIMSVCLSQCILCFTCFLCVCVCFGGPVLRVSKILFPFYLSLSLCLFPHTRIWNLEKYIMVKFKWNRHNITSQNLISEYRLLSQWVLSKPEKSLILQCYQLCWCHIYTHCLIWGSS